ncbi:uncharacterized protein KD926_009651 [Aspergillus affinis]|uniref:uncharacterized protein n=1 Tax=Aspergillus affinis TaxID=1070780 RepID=UPI0022FEA3AE|nr:phosphoglycerate mutase-like protein [Aspergillus affinis]KAI9045237.1 phosphoglycerate mutase-like protein [Aspergillus affinis]
MKYNIPTLLGMSQNGKIPLERFSSPALESACLPTSNAWSKHQRTDLTSSGPDNLVRLQARSTNPLSEQPVNQPRTILDSPCPEVAISGMQPLPHPPPHTPLQSFRPILSQSSDGFQQFVKAHSSPKHQRVTAGGRIVPMEPQIAVPDFNLLQVDETEGRKDEPTSTENTPTQAMHTNFAAGGELKTPYVTPVDLSGISQQANATNDQCQLQPPGYDSGYAPVFPPVTPIPGMFLQSRMPVHRAEYPSQPCYQAVFPEPHVYGVGAFGVDTPIWYPNANPVMNAPGPATPLPAVIQTYNPATAVPGYIAGYHHQSSIAPSTLGQYSQYPALLDTRYVSSTSQWNPDTPKTAQPVTLSQTPVLTGPSIAEMPSRKSFEEARKRHDLLSGQLSRLDRYTALHSWEIDPESKQLFVQQRMSLVKELDTLRLYREQLDAIYGVSNLGMPSDRRENVPVYQTRPKSNRLGKLAINRAPGTLPLSSSSSLSAGLGWTTPGPLIVPPNHQAHVSSEQPFLKQNMKDVNNLAHTIGTRSVPSGCESLTESNLLYNEQIRQADFAPVKRALRAQTTKAFPDGPGRGTAQPDGTSRLQKLYNKIEAASTRREPVGGLLRELSVVTAGLINDGSKKDDGATPRIFGRRAPLTSLTESTGAGFPAKNIPSYGPESRDMQHIRRFWESEPSPKIPSKKLRAPSPETDDESHSRAPSSHTTDSWTTVHKSDQRYFGRDSLSGENPGRRLDSIWKSGPGDRLHNTNLSSGASWSKKTGTKVKPVSMIQRPSAPRGFVAPFDGAGDVPDIGNREQAQGPWYQKKERIKANYAVVRDFLKRIETEEANMVYEYRMAGPGSWW